MNPSDNANPPPPNFTMRRRFIAAPLGWHAGGEEGAGHGDGHGGSKGAGAPAAIGQFKRDMVKAFN